jgi:hypothetical protein
MSFNDERQRRELYVGVFANSHWSSQSLCSYFQQLIGDSSIVACRFYPFTSRRSTQESPGDLVLPRDVACRDSTMFVPFQIIHSLFSRSIRFRASIDV